MNSRQKEVMQAQLDSEEKTLKELKKIYSQALENCEEKIRELSERTDMENLQSIIYQKRYQEALKSQLEGIMANLQSNSYATVSDYLHRCYRDGYIGTMYDIQGQGIPIIMPIDQQAVTRAIQTDSKLSSGLYSRLGEDVKALKTSVRAELSRGIASGYTWNEIAVEIAKSFKNTPFSKAYNRAMTIARTEGHRVAIQSAMDAQEAAKSKGADVVKQWDATLDDRTRDTHRLLDGQIREIGKMFEVAGKKTEAPGMFGDPSEDCNCRCALFQRARWALDEDELSTLQERAEFWGLDKAATFEEYREKYLNIHKMKIEFPNDVYKVKGFTNTVKVEVDNAMKKLQTEYNIKLNSIVVEAAGKGDVFVTGYHDGVVDLVINENADFGRLISRIQDKYESGYFAGKSLEDYLAHEMAHCMLYQDCKTDTEYQAKYRQIEGLYESLKGISGYADKTKSGNEALAEAFVRARNKESISPMAKVLIKSYFGGLEK